MTMINMVRSQQRKLLVNFLCSGNPASGVVSVTKRVQKVSQLCSKVTLYNFTSNLQKVTPCHLTKCVVQYAKVLNLKNAPASSFVRGI